MVADLFLPMVKANELCERAVRYRGGLIADPRLGSAELRALIQFSIPRRDLTRDADGWVQISNLIDRINEVQARIMWHPETDRVRLVWPRGFHALAVS